MNFIIRCARKDILLNSIGNILFNICVVAHDISSSISDAKKYL